MIDLLSRLVQVYGVSAALLATDDGLLVEALGSQVDFHAAAAGAIDVMHAAERMAQLNGHSPPALVTAETNGHVLVLDRIEKDLVLTVLLDGPGNVAYVRYLLERESANSHA